MRDVIFGANAKRYTICWGIRTKKNKKETKLQVLY